MTEWLTVLQQAKKSCIVDGNLKKVHFDLGNGKELVEEYNTDTHVVTRRAWKRNSKLGAEGDWDIEIGEPEPTFNQNDTLIKESSCQPFVSRRNTKRNLEWRIRNLPYPLITYAVTVDKEGRCLIVRTTNKKYFKRLNIPEFDRLNLLPEQDNISLQHKFNTLIITYQKPKELLEFESKVLEEVNKLQPRDRGDMGCKPS